MPNIVIGKRVFDFANWRGTPVTEDEIHECFATYLPTQRPETSRCFGRTVAGRVLLFSYKYPVGSNELTIFQVEDGPEPRDMTADLKDWEATYDKIG